MGTGKTYSTKYLLDSDNNSGVAGQVLVTTATGVSWQDAESTGDNQTQGSLFDSKIILIDTPNGGLKPYRVITDEYGEWIQVGRFAANAQNTIQASSWSSVSGLSTGTSQSETTQFSADFGDCFPDEVRIMGATDFNNWRNTRTIDFVYKVPAGRKWKHFFSNGSTTGMGIVDGVKYGWTVNGAYDGFGRWTNSSLTSIRMSDFGTAPTNPPAAFTTATANAFYWNPQSDAKFSVSATRTFCGQDTFVTSGVGIDDANAGFFDVYPSEVTNMQGGAIFSSAIWILIKVPGGASGGGGDDVYWSENGNDIHNDNTGNVGIGVTDPQAKLEVKGTSAGPADGNEIISVTNTTGNTKLLLGVVENFYGWIQSAEGSTYRDLLLNPLGGSVGIGTDSPIHPLYVAGDIGQTDGSRIWFRGSSSSSGTGAQSYVYSNGLNLQIKGDDNVQILGDGGGTIAHFDYTGNVGIGTTVPANKLQVNAASAIADTLILKLDGGKVGFSGNNDANIKHGLVFDLCSYNSSTGIVQRQAAKIEVQKVGSWNESAGGSGTKADIVFSTNNGTIATPAMVEKMRITSAGNVGIGTATFASTPNLQLKIGNMESGIVGEIFDAADDADNSRIIVCGGGSGTPQFSMRHYSAGYGIDMWLNTNSPWDTYIDNRNAASGFIFRNNCNDDGAEDELIRITGSGNVGIGNTSPTNKLHIQGSQATVYSPTDSGGQASAGTTINNTNTAGNTNNFSQLLFTVGTNNNSVSRIVAIRSGSDASDLAFVGKSAAGVAEYMRIKSGGDVGIGTDSPANKLDVKISTSNRTTLEPVMSVSAEGSGPYTGFGPKISFSSNIYYGAATGNPAGIIETAYIGAVMGTTYATNSDLVFATRDGATSVTEKMRILGNGNVGIGTTSPGSLLTLNGDGQANNYSGVLRIYNTYTNDPWGHIGLPDSLSSTTNSNNFYLIGRGNSYTDRVMSFHIPRDGDYGSGAQPKFGFYSTGSDLLHSIEAETGTSYFKGNVGVGTTNPASEANLSLAAKSTSEGGHLALFKGTSQTQATHLDNYANTFRIMNGADASSGAVQFSLNHTTAAATFAGNITTPTQELSTAATPTSFGTYTSEIRLIDTPNGGLKKCRVITDNYGEWILVGRFAADAMSTIQSTWSSESGLDTSTSQSTTTKFSADFGDSYPTEVRIMGATDFNKWRDTRTIDFVYGVPEGRKWKNFFSGGTDNGMALSGKYGWGINGAYDGFGRWVNPAQNFVRMSDGNVTNPSAAYTTATANAFNWEGAADAKITVSATRVFSGQDTFVTAGFGNDDGIQGFFDEYPNETNNMQGGLDFSSAVWVLIKLPTALSSGSGSGAGNQWAGGPDDIHNTNTGNVGIGTNDPDEKLDITGGYLKFNGGDYGIKGSASLTYNPVSDHYFMSSGSTKVTIKASGNVGIGMTNPLVPLDVEGKIRSNDSNSGDYLEIFCDGSVSGDSYIENTNNNIQIKSASDTVFSNNSSERMRISNSGDVTIGKTTAALGRLDVSGTLVMSVGTTARFKTFYSGGFTFINGGVSGNDIYFGAPTSYTQNIRVQGTGIFNSTVTATNFILSSDKTLKENVKDIDTKHIDVNWKNFELKSEPGVKRSGVIAQELEKKHPEFVRTNEDGLKSVAYIDLLIAKIAELEARLEKAGI